MGRKLNKQEQELLIQNRNALYDELTELQADFEDLANNELLACRDEMRKRINRCLKLILETEEDIGEF